MVNYNNNAINDNNKGENKYNTVVYHLLINLLMTDLPSQNQISLNSE